ncbi:hypothetical protein GGI07_003126 [Coemansia sp. Benny D115]|nr:hypothetical protein GGI07_003126 [Coemansia sp. Benny D115]
MPSIGSDSAAGTSASASAAVAIAGSNPVSTAASAATPSSATISESTATSTSGSTAPFSQQASFADRQSMQAASYPNYHQPPRHAYSHSQSHVSGSYYQQQPQQQQQQQQLRSHGYQFGYPHGSTLGSSPPQVGFIGGSPPGPISISASTAVSSLNGGGGGGGSGGGYAIVAGQAYAYYPGALAGSPTGSPQMAPLPASPPGSGHYLAHMPTGQLQGTSPGSVREHDLHLMHPHQPAPLAGAAAPGMPTAAAGVAMPAQIMAQRIAGSPVALSMSPPYMGTMHHLAEMPAPSTSEVVDSRNVYIRNLPEDCTDEVLLRLASPFGEIESSKSIIHEVSGKCKGYGFVKYKTEEQAERAIEAFKAQGLQSTLAKDSFKSKLKRLQDKNSANVYISNLSTEIDENALIELIKPHAVVSARILRDAHTGQHKGAGFARMADRDTALLVIEKLKRIRLPGAPGPLLPRIADSEGQKQLKKQINGEGGGRFDDGTSTSALFIRSETTSPLMWSPVFVYSPAGSPPAIHGFDTLGVAAAAAVAANSVAGADGTSRQQQGASTSSSSQQQSHSLGTHDQHQQQHQRFIGGQQGYPIAAANGSAGLYAIPTPAHHYTGYMSPGYASPLGFGSPPHGYASNGGYISPGYLSSGGYASPVQMPASPQLAYAHLPDQQQYLYEPGMGQASGDVVSDEYETNAEATVKLDGQGGTAGVGSVRSARSNSNGHHHRRRPHHGRPSLGGSIQRRPRSDSRAKSPSAAESSSGIGELAKTVQKKLSLQ